MNFDVFPFTLFLAGLNLVTHPVLELTTTFLNVCGVLKRRMSPPKRKVKRLASANPRKARKEKRRPYLNLAGLRDWSIG
ncbi:hypothetical protein GCM10026983_18780 [Gracilibacillus alcaliphilus]